MMQMVGACAYYPALSNLRASSRPGLFHAMPAIRLKHFIRSAESAYAVSPSHVVGFVDVGFGGQGGAVFAGINYPF